MYAGSVGPVLATGERTEDENHATIAMDPAGVAVSAPPLKPTAAIDPWSRANATAQTYKCGLGAAAGRQHPFLPTPVLEEVSGSAIGIVTSARWLAIDTAAQASVANASGIASSSTTARTALNGFRKNCIDDGIGYSRANDTYEREPHVRTKV